MKTNGCHYLHLTVPSTGSKPELDMEVSPEGDGTWRKDAASLHSRFEHYSECDSRLRKDVSTPSSVGAGFPDYF